MLHLHIGTSKAGSTTIQDFLLRGNTAELGFGQIDCFGRGNAWKLAAASGTRNAVRYWVHGRSRLTDAAFAANQQELWTHLAAELEHSGHSAFIASSEYLYRHYFDEAQALEVLRDRLLTHFGDVRIILYLRDQRAYLRSLYAQTVVGAERTEKDFAVFVEKCRKVDALWNYARGVQLWQKVFGAARLQVIPFSRENFFRQDLISDFLFRVSPQIAERHAAGIRIPARNVSPDYAQLRAVRLVNRLPLTPDRIPDRLLRRLAESRLSRLLGPATFPDDHDDAILRLVSDSNAWVNTAVLDGFDVKLPVHPGAGAR